ncbi:hypothetical protein JXA32_11990 [Candidatus Sumerlaeota bacterium]|nr:hypothetical protein [Candidatus Sumerlaeota bacterium]
MDLPTQKERNYCWQCGRPVAPQQEKCYFCNSRQIRHISDPRRCPFCFGEIHEKAIKCHHCGEFLNQTAASAEQAESVPIDAELVESRQSAQQPNIVFFIPAQLSPDGQPRLIPAGEKLSGPALQQLTAQTRKAIESGRPETLDMPGVKALPPAEAKRVLALEAPRASSADLEVTKTAVIGGSSGDEPRDAAYEIIRRPTAAPPSPRGQASTADTAKALGASAARGAWKAMLFLAPILVRGIKKILTMRWKKAPQQEPEEEETPRLRNCERCQTEVLYTDKYCYHCGKPFVKVRKKIKRPPRNIRSNMGHYIGMALCYGAYSIASFGLNRVAALYGDYLKYLDYILFIPPVIGVLALLRRVGIDSIIWLAASVFITFYLLQH